jgi:predicted PurR-regulated permease PerM
MKDVIPAPSHSGLAERVIAAGVIIGFLYWAEIVVLTVILSVLLAYFLDPLVQLMERWHVPRALGSLIVLLLATAVLVGLGVLTGSRLNRFIADWPRYSAMLQNASAVVAEHLRHFMQGFLHLRPEEAGKGFGFVLAEQDSLRNLLLRGLGSLYSLIWVLAFIPFLVFFMLWEKNNVWQSTLNLFPSAQREQARSGLEELSAALRGYIVGNAIVAGILVLTSWLFFWLIGLEYAFLSALFSGLLNLVPYLGAVLAWIPPFASGLGEWSSIGPFLGVAMVLTVQHIIAINALFPALVGRRVHLNAVSVAIGLLFWGWLWGGIGLILAIPIIVTMKVICDQVDTWRPIGQWLGATPRA